MKALVQKLVDLAKAWVTTVSELVHVIEDIVLGFARKIFGFLAPTLQLGGPLWRLVKRLGRLLLVVALLILPLASISIVMGKLYQAADRDETRGAFAITSDSAGETYTTPVYVDQGWSTADSMWFYNTTQGSNLLPYDFLVELEQPSSQDKFISANHIDGLRYLPQKPTFFNPDALPVGFVKDTYQNRDYVGLTCAACHTGQVNYQGNAVRIDGGPASADMDEFLRRLQWSLAATRQNAAKKDRFVTAVLARNTLTRGMIGGAGYSSVDEIESDLALWSNRIVIYNLLNHSKVRYGYGRLDAFGRIYNRVLEHVLDKRQVANQAAFVVYPDGSRVLGDDQIDFALEGLNSVVIGRSGFELMMQRLMSDDPRSPRLNTDDITLVANSLFNPADAPVSYPFLWDIAQSDYVQWNGLAANAGIGPLGRNAGEVIGVFGTLDWVERSKGWWDKLNLAGRISGQGVKTAAISFSSSIDKVNLHRLETHLKELKSPRWEDVRFADGSGLPAVDRNSDKWQRGEQLYSQYCQSCHELIDRNDPNRRVVGVMLGLDKVGTDPKMADNGAGYTGQAGNFSQIYQDTDVGPVIVQAEAPVVQILTAATRGVIATPDADKWWPRRVADWVYTLFVSISANDIQPSVKSGDYEPDTTSNPYASLLAYKARPLNGIWATAPYLHNGSVPTLYDLLLPKKRPDDPEVGEYRRDSFGVGCRELDVRRVGIDCPMSSSQIFTAERNGQPVLGNSNSGHEYAAGRTNALKADQPLPAMGEADRWALIEYLKTL